MAACSDRRFNLAATRRPRDRRSRILGVARLIADGFHCDAGAVYSAFSASRDYDYGEVFAGITSSNFNARVHYSPDYFGFGRGSLYGEMNGTHRLGGDFTLLGHIGVLVPLGEGD